MNYKLLLLPFSFAIIGYFVTNKKFVLFMDRIGPTGGLIVYYIIVAITILLLEWIGLIISDIRMNSTRHFIGMLMLNFAIFIVIIWSNCYVSEMVRKNCKNFSGIYLNTESGATYDVWSRVLKNKQNRRITAFVVTPFVISLLALMIIRWR